MSLISVIVPVYRSETLLRICADSILAQTHAELELLLVDDGSPDGAGALCDRIAASDARVRVFHKENGGVSSARNLGIQEARGDYVLFVDSDDRIEPSMCQTLLTALHAAEADTAGCAHYNLLPDGMKWEEAALPAGVYEKDAIRRMLVLRLLGHRLGKPGEVLNGFVWRFLFSRELLSGLSFEGSYLEDELFLMEYFSRSRKLVMLDMPLYYYLQNPASATRRYLADYMPTFRRFFARKQALAQSEGLDAPNWEAETCWAGVLIAAGNEFAPGSPGTRAEKRRRVEACLDDPVLAPHLASLAPAGLGRNKQLAADLLRTRRLRLLSLLYAIKNRGR
ncbi:MAG TPA: glycosyltransferase [Oscillospiraceae bacterium]|nr:glycosyltransferase [Oscillospiraceae bacterium]